MDTPELAYQVVQAVNEYVKLTLQVAGYRYRLGEEVAKEESVTTTEGRDCQYFFKDANRYCVMRGPHNEHTTSIAADKVPHALQEKCARCGFTKSAHADQYCPVGHPQRNWTYISHAEVLELATKGQTVP